MLLELLKLPLHFYTDPIWKKEQAHNKEQQTTRNEGIYLQIYFFFFLPPNLGVFLILFLHCRLVSGKLQNNWL